MSLEIANIIAHSTSTNIMWMAMIKMKLILIIMVVFKRAVWLGLGTDKLHC